MNSVDHAIRRTESPDDTGHLQRDHAGAAARFARDTSSRIDVAGLVMRDMLAAEAHGDSQAQYNEDLRKQEEHYNLLLGLLDNAILERNAWNLKKKGAGDLLFGKWIDSLVNRLKKHNPHCGMCARCGQFEEYVQHDYCPSCRTEMGE
jgi:hypothetical protein